MPVTITATRNGRWNKKPVRNPQAASIVRFYTHSDEPVWKTTPGPTLTTRCTIPESLSLITIPRFTEKSIRTIKKQTQSLIRRLSNDRGTTFRSGAFADADSLRAGWGRALKLVRNNAEMITAIRNVHWNKNDPQAASAVKSADTRVYSSLQKTSICNLL